MQLVWQPIDGSLYLIVADDSTGEQVAASVPADRALDAFRHPYAYLDRLPPVAIAA